MTRRASTVDVLDTIALVLAVLLVVVACATGSWLTLVAFGMDGLTAIVVVALILAVWLVRELLAEGQRERGAR